MENGIAFGENETDKLKKLKTKLNMAYMLSVRRFVKHTVTTLVGC